MVRLDSIFWILILTFGVLVYRKADFDKSNYKDQSAPIERSIIKNNATVTTGIQYYCFQKIWIPNKDNFRLLTFNQIEFLDNNKVDQKILILDKSRKKSKEFLIAILHYQLLPKESDEIPILS